MSSFAKSASGKKSSSGPSTSLPPPSYATRPPKGHKVTESGRYDDEYDEDAEDDYEIEGEDEAPKGKGKERAGTRSRQQQYSDNEDEAPKGKRKGRAGTKPRREEYSDDEDDCPRGKGKGKGKPRRCDHSDDEREYGREDLSRAVVRRAKSPSDQESDNDSDRGRDSRRRKNKTQVSNRTGGHSKSVTRSHGRGGDEEDDDDDDQQITVGRWGPVSIDQLLPGMTAAILRTFDISLEKLESFCERGKIREDRRDGSANLDKIYPLFPDHMRARWEDIQEEAKRKVREREGRGGHMNPSSGPAAIYNTPVIVLSPLREPCCGDRRCLIGTCRRCEGTGWRLY